MDGFNILPRVRAVSLFSTQTKYVFFYFGHLVLLVLRRHCQCDDFNNENVCSLFSFFYITFDRSDLCQRIHAMRRVVNEINKLFNFSKMCSECYQNIYVWINTSKFFRLNIVARNVLPFGCNLIGWISFQRKHTTVYFYLLSDWTFTASLCCVDVVLCAFIIRIRTNERNRTLIAIIIKLFLFVALFLSPTLSFSLPLSLLLSFCILLSSRFATKSHNRSTCFICARFCFPVDAQLLLRTHSVRLNVYGLKNIAHSKCIKLLYFLRRSNKLWKAEMGEEKKNKIEWEQWLTYKHYVRR